MAYLKLRAVQRLSSSSVPSTVTHFSRPFTTTSPFSKLMDTPNPKSNLPDPSENSSAAPNAKMRSDTQNTDHQSSASQDEHKSGDDHPAKQPDYQAQPSRTTGIGGGEKVEGGKEGLHERGDKQ